MRSWAVVTAAASAAMLLSLALPWAREWNGQRTAGVAVLFYADDHRPHLGVLLLALWAVAVAGAARGTRAWWWPAMAAAAAAVALGPAYYAREIAGESGLAIGKDAAGRIVEWEVRGHLTAGFAVAAIGTALLCAGILLRRRSLAPSA